MNANSSISTRDPWLSLPPKGGREKNETSLNINPRRPSKDRQAQIPGQAAGPPDGSYCFSLRAASTQYEAKYDAR
jgi:hypothetical protein